MSLKVFLYQCTIRKVGIKYDLPSSLTKELYPKKYLVMYAISHLKWVALGVLIFYNWIAALVCFAIGSILFIVLPEQSDYKNIMIAQNVLNEKTKCGLIKMDIANLLRRALNCAIDEIKAE